MEAVVHKFIIASLPYSSLYSIVIRLKCFTGSQNLQSGGHDSSQTTAPSGRMAVI